MESSTPATYMSTIKPVTSNMMILPNTTTTSSDNITSNENTTGESSDYIALIMQIYLSPILVILGTAGNLLSFSVLMRKRMRGTSIYNFLAVLAIIDTGVLWIDCFMTWIGKISSFKVVHHSNAACIVSRYLFLSFTYTASWLIVLITVERVFAIWYPIRIKAMLSLRSSRIAVALLVFIIFALHSYVFWTYKHQWDSKGRLYCTFDQKNSIMKQANKYYHFVLYCALPFAIVLTCNMFIIGKLKNPSVVRENSTQNNLGEGNFQPQQKISILLLTVTFAWFLLMLPYSILSIVKTFHNTKVLRITFFMLIYINHSINFFLYCITGQKFRSELRVMVRSWKCQKKAVRRGDSARSTQKTDLLLDSLPLKPINKKVLMLQKNHSALALIPSGTGSLPRTVKAHQKSPRGSF